MSTASAIIALQPFPKFTSPVIEGLRFIQKNCGYLEDLPLDRLPVGVSLILPRLLHEMSEQGLVVDTTGLSELFAFGQKRRQKLGQIEVTAPSPLLHVFEGWGQDPHPDYVDALGSVGHSPASTSHWLKLAQVNGASADRVDRAQAYLRRSSDSLGGFGLHTCNWPMPRFEQSFGLWILLLSGLLTDPLLNDVISEQLTDLRTAIRADGIGMSDCFPSDGDDTAALAAVLTYLGDYSLIPVLLKKSRNGHFLTYPMENHPSLTTTARCCHALRISGLEPPSESIAYLLGMQQQCGRWLEDKWHTSWLYITLHGIVALGHQHRDAVIRAVQALIKHQHQDGGWGVGASTASETAYAIHGLAQCHEWQLVDVTGPLLRAYSWLDSQSLDQVDRTRLWIGKGGYCPVRVDQMFVLTALLRCERMLKVHEMSLI